MPRKNPGDEEDQMGKNEHHRTRTEGQQVLRYAKGAMRKWADAGQTSD